MTFLAPFFFFLGLGVAAAAAALHFIVTRQPPSSPLPTARFVPEGSVLVTTVAKPTDLPLLALRVLLAIVVGAAFARPILVRTPRPIARIVVADVSNAVGSITTIRDSAHSLLRDDDVLVVFDSIARAVERGAADSALKLEGAARQGRVSAALIVAFRSAAKLRATADSLELVIISPFRATEIDGATFTIRKLWPGRIRLVPVPASEDVPAVTTGFTVRANGGDPVALAATIGTMARADALVRIIRAPATAEDNAWATNKGHTLVRWPVEGAPPHWIARDTIDTVGAVAAGQTALVFPFERRWRLPPSARPARVTARWVDGEPAAADYAAGDGCIRDVAVPVPTRGDVMLRPTFGRLLEMLGAPCAIASGGPAADERTLAMLAGTGPLAAAKAIAPPVTIATPLVPWFLALALVLVLVEAVVRRNKV